LYGPSCFQLPWLSIRFQENTELRARLERMESDSVKRHSETHALEDKINSLENEEGDLERQEAKDRCGRLAQCEL
jgi:hypothetical protein